MVHDDRARPVSGEIMTAAIFDGGAARSRDTKDASDAQFVTLPRAETVTAAPSKNAAGAIAGPMTSQSAGMSLLTQNVTPTRQTSRLANHRANHRASRHGGLLFWSAGLSCVALAFWVSGGHALITSGNILQPATTKQPLRISAVESRIEAVDGQEILFVDGYAQNHGVLALALPAIEIAVTGNGGSVRRYHLGSQEPQLEPGSRYIFSSRLQAPNAGVKTVSVAFVEEER